MGALPPAQAHLPAARGEQAAPRPLTSLAEPTRRQCWWIVQDEASNTITLPSLSAHQSFG